MNEVKFPITSIHHIYLAHVENRSWKESKVGYPKYYQVGTLMVATFKDVNSLLETMLLCLITEAALFNSADQVDPPEIVLAKINSVNQSDVSFLCV